MIDYPSKAAPLSKKYYFFKSGKRITPSELARPTGMITELPVSLRRSRAAWPPRRQHCSRDIITTIHTAIQKAFPDHVNRFSCVAVSARIPVP